MEKKYTPVSPEQAVQEIRNGDRIHIHSVACSPRVLVEAMCDRVRAGNLTGLTLQHIHTE